MSLQWTFHDSVVIGQRQLRRIPRVPQALFFSLLQPVIFLLLFAFVFARSIPVPGRLDYIDFLVPGTFVQTTTFAAAATAVGLADESRNGLMDRFRSLPMSHSAVLLGRVLADAVRNLLVMAVLLAIGSAIGFRFGNGPLQIVGGLLVLLLFSFAFSCFAATIGLAARMPEVAQLAMTLCTFPLVFASSAYVPVGNMPGWMQAWTQYSPVTMTIDAVRALLLGYGGYHTVLPALLWSVGLVAVFLPLAVRTFRRAADRT